MHPKPPDYLHAWLTYTDSITNKLKQHVYDVHMQLLTHTWEACDAWDKHKLALTDTLVLHREILMFAHTQPCWYARTVIPEHTFALDPVLFLRLEQEPLGALLFQFPSPFIRKSLEIYPIYPGSDEFQWITQAEHPSTMQHVGSTNNVLWMRLSEFMLHQMHSIFLAEVFLPHLEQCILSPR